MRRGGVPGTAPEPGAAFLGRLRRELTAWYTAVLVATLAASGLVLFFGLRDQLMRPTSDQLGGAAEFTARMWQQSPSQACARPTAVRGGLPRGTPGLPPPSRLPGRPPVYIACIDLQERVLGSMSIPGGEGDPLPEAFLKESLAAKALAGGRASDVVDGGEEVGPLYRIAVRVADPTSGVALGVVQVGRSIAQQVSALRLLRDLLLALGALAVLIATAGGLFLANRALAPAQLALGRQQAFIADASHELRTPLTLIRANAEVLLRQRERLDPSDAELVEDVVSETRHMERLTDNLLTLARLDAGEMRLERAPLDLSEVAAAVARRLAPLAREKNVDLGGDYGEGVRLVGDREALEQAARILLENAIKYTPSGGTVGLRTSVDGDQVSLVVEDTGIGISPEHLPHLGGRFYRVDPARSREAGGAGLGLAIASGIAAAHGGTMQISSRPGAGTRVTIRLPVGGA